MLHLAAKLAKDIPKFGNARLGCVLAVRNRIISFGTNNNPKTHPLAKLFSKNRHAVYPHAELSAIINAQRRNFTDWEKATLYVARVVVVNNRFELALARPCDGCWGAIESYGISNVEWTIDNNKKGVFRIDY